ncbi:hypothetical protein LZ318_18970 [Saccharopolyspora indica]|uniref:hypothetical protein n=1 Tax=Saccharopolyspora indica TaxID=1229659 RepID=UPI0022EB6B3F|nr:hypothetical protein [Saccharopolyspora indica]MDA3645432.1 hypothetical protein [Saccharopolyspora indica]
MRGAQVPESGGRRALRIIAAVFLPWSTAKFLLKPGVGQLPRDRLLDRLGFWRAATGLLVVVVASGAYLSPLDVLSNVQAKTQLTAGYALAGIPLVFLVVLAVTRSVHRRRFVASVPRLLRRVGIGLACCFVPLVGVFAFVGSFSLLDGNGDGQITGVWGLVAFLLAVPGFFTVVPWCAVFFACTVYWLARTGFCLGELHPLLAPVGSVGLALVVSVREVYLWNTEGVPAVLWLGLNIGGLLSTLVLGFFEFRHLRAGGHRFREGPDPVSVGG